MGLETLHIKFQDQTTPTGMFCPLDPILSSIPSRKTKKGRLKNCVSESTGLMVVLRGDVRHIYFFCVFSDRPQISHREKSRFLGPTQGKQDRHLWEWKMGRTDSSPSGAGTGRVPRVTRRAALPQLATPTLDSSI